MRIPRGEEEKVDDDERTGDDEPPSRPSREESPLPRVLGRVPGVPRGPTRRAGRGRDTRLLHAAAPWRRRRTTVSGRRARGCEGGERGGEDAARPTTLATASDRTGCAARSAAAATRRLGARRGGGRGGAPGQAKEETVGEQDGEGVEDDVEGVEAERAGAGGVMGRRPVVRVRGRDRGRGGSRPPIAALRRKVSTVSGRQLLWLASLVKFWPQ